MVIGNLAISEAEREARRAEEDARWREEVERTLRALGYENTAEGIALAEMRAALAAGDEAFKAWSEAQFRAYDSQPDPEATGFEELRAALDAGGEAWEAYTQTQQQPGEGGADGSAPPARGKDFGGLQVGTGAEGGNLEGASDRFAPLPALSTVWRFEELPDGTACEVVWTRDGAELTRSSREVGGSGWVSFQIRGGGRGNLPPGEYVVTLSVGGQAVGQKTFIVTD